MKKFIRKLFRKNKNKTYFRDALLFEDDKRRKFRPVGGTRQLHGEVASVVVRAGDQHVGCSCGVEGLVASAVDTHRSVIGVEDHVETVVMSVSKPDDLSTERIGQFGAILRCLSVFSSPDSRRELVASSETSRISRRHLHGPVYRCVRSDLLHCLPHRDSVSLLSFGANPVSNFLLSFCVCYRPSCTAKSCSLSVALLGVILQRLELRPLAFASLHATFESLELISRNLEVDGRLSVGVIVEICESLQLISDRDVLALGTHEGRKQS